MLASENLYYRVMEDIRVKIMDGTYPLNSKISSEKKLQDIYGISRVTLRNAIDGLVKDGLIERIQGKGSYVRKPKKIIRMLRYPD
ncbi:GntR family transcriptional regulator, partial [Liquorilactobacillus sp.]